MRATLQLLVALPRVRAELVGRRGTIWAGEAPCGSPDELQAGIAQLVGEASLPARAAGLLVRLASPPAQVRTLQELPPVRARELRALVAAQSGRYFRRNGKPLVTNAVWPDRRSRRLGKAQAAAVEEPWVEAILGGAREAGLEVQAIWPEAGPGSERLGLFTGNELRRRKIRERLALRRLGGAAALVWAGVAGILMVRFEGERRAIAEELTRLEEPARAVMRARTAMDQAAAAVAAIEIANRDRAGVLVRLGAIAAALPDSAFLTSLTLRLTGEGTMSGAARRTNQAIGRLEEAGVLVSPRLAGPIVREQVEGRAWERFSLSFEPGVVR